MVSPSVQFYGAEKVLSMAGNRECPYWGIFQGRQFLFKFETHDMTASMDHLGQILGCLENSQAVYTIRFYEPEGKNKAVKIKDNTPYDGSFNFRMISEDERMQRGMVIQSNNNAVLQKLNEIDARLGAIESGEIEEVEEEEQDNSITGILLGLLKDPTKMQETIRNIGMVKDIFTGNTPAFMGHVNRLQQGQSSGPPAGPGSARQQELSPEDEQAFLMRLGNALDILKVSDPLIADHLEKLAKISQENKPLFNTMLTMLDGYQ